MKNLVASMAIFGLLLVGCATSDTKQPSAPEQTTKISPHERAKRAMEAQNLSGQKQPSAQAQEYFDKFLTSLDKKDYGAAKDNVDKACELDHAEACYADGQLYLRVGNLQAAKGRFERACGLEHKFGCAQLGITLLNLDQINDAVDTLNKACDMGDGLACGNLGNLYSGKHPRIKQDILKSKGYYAKACKLGIEQTNVKVDFCEMAK